MRLLLTRPERDAEATAAALAAEGHHVVRAPLMRIEPIRDVALGAGPWSALVITSANALAAIATHAQRTMVLRLPVFAVGKRTAAAARAAGFAEVTEAGGNLKELAQVLRAGALVKARGHPLLYLAGEERSGDLAGELGRHGETLATVVVYRAVKSTTFAEPVIAALKAGAIDGVLHYSRRSAEAFLECARAGGLAEAALKPAHYCLSGQVAEPLVTAGAESVRIAPRPEEAALIALIAHGGSAPC